jgi:FkbM family methyltransferase
MLNIEFIRQVGFFKWARRYAYLQIRKRMLGLDTLMMLPTGSRILLPRQSRSATEVYVTDANIDCGAEALFATFADRNRDFLDVGAHIGYYSNYLAPLIRRVYAFEPDERNIPGLQANARLTGNVEIVRAAVSSSDGVAPFHVARGSALSSLAGSGDGADVTVPTTTIDTFVAQRPEVDVALIKIDIEGHDLEALHGMQRTVARDQPLILTECKYSRELADLCATWQYRIFAFVREPATRVLSLQRMTSNVAQQYQYKMLFLVPARLSNTFEDQSV